MNILKYFISVVLDNLKIKYVLTEVKECLYFLVLKTIGMLFRGN